MADRGSEPDFYPLEMGYLPPEFVKKAETELFEYPRSRESQMKEVRELLKKEGIREDWFNDDALIMFLRSRKYNVHKTCSSIKKMVAFVRKNPKYFRPMDPAVRDKIIERGIVRMMPRRSNDGCFIYIIKLGRWEPSEISLDDFVGCVALMFLHALNDPMSQVNGMKFIYDFDAPVLKYLRYVSPMYLYLYYYIFLECIPLRVNSVHAVNPTNTIAKLVQRLFVPLCSEKIQRKIKIHYDLSSLVEHIQPNVLPQEYGGLLTKEECHCAWTKTMSMPSYINLILDSINERK